MNDTSLLLKHSARPCGTHSQPAVKIKKSAGPFAQYGPYALLFLNPGTCFLKISIASYQTECLLSIVF